STSSGTRKPCRRTTTSCRSGSSSSPSITRGSEVATRNYMSIGEVLVTLKTEFPDITISKIRFLEGEGLIDPERTPSGYRKFRDEELQRLRAILRMQRDEYLPLKVIRERLEQGEDADGETSVRQTAPMAEDEV